jgi:protein-S-isoprenylcysteine O-methyltransferase Ste14
MPEWSVWLVRRRVALGFACGAVAMFLARPTWTTWIIGCSVAAIGEGVRIWAAGHLEKDREVTSSGPYRFTAHPLYLGSTIIGVGFAIAASTAAVTALVGLYLATTLPAAMQREEEFLYTRFGNGPHARVDKKFSLARARRNREHRTIAGFAIVAVMLALEAALRG